MAGREAGGPDDPIDCRRRMNVGPDLLASQSGEPVHDPAAGPDPPQVARVDETVPAPRVGDRQPNEHLHVRIAADDSVEGDDVGGFDGRARATKSPT